MVGETKETMIRACLAALARRAGKTGLVVRYDEIGHDFHDHEIELACDGDARCVRITAASLPSAAQEEERS